MLSGVLFWIALILATSGAVLARLLVNALCEHVKTAHPATYEALASVDRGLIKGLSQPDGRARRAMASALLKNKLPEALQADEQIMRMAQHWRVLFFGAIGFTIAVVVILVFRSAAS